VLAGPYGRVGSVAPGCVGQLACQRWDRPEGGERREKVRDLSAKSKNSRGLGEKGAKTHSSQGQIKIFEYHFCSTFQAIHFLFNDYVYLSNV
jgi:hypothetical protein